MSQESWSYLGFIPPGTDMGRGQTSHTPSGTSPKVLGGFGGGYSLVPLVRALGDWDALDGRLQHDIVPDIRGDEDVPQVLQWGHRHGTWGGLLGTAHTSGARTEGSRDGEKV